MRTRATAGRGDVNTYMLKPRFDYRIFFEPLARLTLYLVGKKTLGYVFGAQTCSLTFHCGFAYVLDAILPQAKKGAEGSLARVIPSHNVAKKNTRKLDTPPAVRERTERTTEGIHYCWNACLDGALFVAKPLYRAPRNKS